MSFLTRENNQNVFFHTKLTDRGRRLLSVGQLSFNKITILDQEIDYSFPIEDYIYENNFVFSPKDINRLTSQNLNGSDPINAQDPIIVGSKRITGDTLSMGFFSSATEVYDFKLDATKYLSATTITSSQVDGTRQLSIPGMQSGGLVMFKFSAPAGSQPPLSGNTPFVCLWYRYTGDTSTITLDRSLPNFSSGSRVIPTHFYPWNGVRDFFGSAATIQTNVWNLNIVRSSSEIGTQLIYSGYNIYGSKGYNGTQKYFGLEKSCRMVGFVHYTNEHIFNPYFEKWSFNTVQIDIPYIMWHRNIGVAGESEQMGLRLTDQISGVFYDDVAGSKYTILMDGNTSNSVDVGRVYHELKTIVITDPELLTALSYKSNRNWTMPPLDAFLTSNPKSPQTIQNSTGLCETGRNYYVTYLVKNSSPYSVSSSMGYANHIHCGYVTKISGYTDNDNRNSYLRLRFKPNSFPYLRDSSGIAAFSGTGWSANQVQILISDIDENYDNGINSIEPSSWRILNFSGYSNGAFSGNPLSASDMENQEFVISKQDYIESSAYDISGLTSLDFLYKSDFKQTGMTYGNESFFFGNVKVDTIKTVFTNVFPIILGENDFNTSNNPTFDPNINDVWITEINILNQNDEVVAISKPTRPVKKNKDIILALKIGMDF